MLSDSDVKLIVDRGQTAEHTYARMFDESQTDLAKWAPYEWITFYGDRLVSAQVARNLYRLAIPDEGSTHEVALALAAGDAYRLIGYAMRNRSGVEGALDGVRAEEAIKWLRLNSRLIAKLPGDVLTGVMFEF